VFATGFITFPLMFLLFPTGRPRSPRWRFVLWLIAVGLALIVVPMAVAAWPLRGPTLIGGPSRSESFGGPALALTYVGVYIVGLCILASVVSLASRFRRAASVERQQIKWLLYAGAFTFIMTFTVSPAAPFELSSGKLPGFVLALVSLLAYLAVISILVAMGIAILRHRLYDIDVVINRTLVYGALTATLALIYFGEVATVQAIFGALTTQEQQPQLAVVVSTLVIAALFAPLRRRIQGFIDSRFYRRKYDARKTLEGFSARVRDATDLEALRASGNRRRRLSYMSGARTC
jgi:hypothetical protein